MLEPTEGSFHTPETVTAPTGLTDAIEAAGRVIAPLWTLRNFVAVNPFLGFTQLEFHRGLREIERLHHAQGSFSVELYRELRAAGRITESDLAQAIEEAPDVLDRPDLARRPAEALRRALDAPLRRVDPSERRMRTYAELVDRLDGTDWSRLVVAQIASFCAARFDMGQSSWHQPWAELPLYTAWRAHARWDRDPELHGVRGFREYVQQLPADAEETIAIVLEQLAVPRDEWQGLLARELASIAGWAGHLQFRIREAQLRGREPEVSLTDLLAIRLAWDGALHRLTTIRRHPSAWPALCTQISTQASRASHRGSDGAAVARSEGDSDALLTDLEARLLWQTAYETAYRRALLAKLRASRGSSPDPNAAPLVQAAFCIDVRSERLRRNLEAVSDRVQTIGFAGFFGFAIEYVHPTDETAEARCPALLAPAHRIRETGRSGGDAATRLLRREERHTLMKRMRLSTVGAFPFVETIGHFFGLRLATDSLGWSRPEVDSRLFAARRKGEFEPNIEPSIDGNGRTGLDGPARIALAEGMLRNMGLVRNFAPLVLICGHGSRTTNNAYASGLDCGACGGYPGDVNAIVAARVLNDPDVREALAERGIEIPSVTRFVAALHETTTDRVELLETEGADPALLEQLCQWLEQAGQGTRSERAPWLGLEPDGSAESSIRRRVLRRSSDWSEVRPEWGLAGNAALIVAPRARTRGLDLDGRCFLHDYQADLDTDGGVLELIMTAPLVVASWINLQYYASTVDNDVFGSGSKVLHNVVGRHGVMLGNASDLRPGLPWQSVHDGERFVHEPLRLQVVLEAPLDRIEGVLERHEALRQLIGNGWVHLVAIEPEGERLHRWRNGGFEEI